VTTLAAVTIAGAALLACRGALAAVTGRLRAGMAVQATALGILGVAGVAVLTGGEVVGASFRSSVTPALGLDPLSGFFLATLALTGVPTLVFARDYLSDSASGRAVGSLTAAFLLALVGVLAARDITTRTTGRSAIPPRWRGPEAACRRWSRSPRSSASAPRPDSFRSTPGCRARTRSPRPTCRP
jgi:hypothetical protein